MAECLMHQTSYLGITIRMSQWAEVVSLSKKLHTHCSVLIGSRNGLKSLFISLKATYTIELK